jgi:hypothetical protein
VSGAALTEGSAFYCAGRTALSTTLLQREYALVKYQISQKIERSQALTISTDGWTNSAGLSVYGTSVIFNDRTVELLDVADLSGPSHTGEFIAGEILEGSVPSII